MITELDDEDFTATLVDFGLVTKYIKKGSHIAKDEQSENFNGVIAFASLDKLNFFATSRRDDIHSMFYMLVDLLNDNKPYGDKELTMALNKQ